MSLYNITKNVMFEKVVMNAAATLSAAGEQFYPQSLFGYAPASHHAVQEHNLANGFVSPEWSHTQNAASYSYNLPLTSGWYTSR